MLLSSLDRNRDLAAARDESRRLHEDLHAALHAIPHPVVIYDKDFNFRAWNNAFSEIQGYTDEMMRRFGGMEGLLRYEVEELDSFKGQRSEEHTSELQSLMRISYAVFCLKKKKQQHTQAHTLSKQKNNRKQWTHVAHTM